MLFLGPMFIGGIFSITGAVVFLALMGAAGLFPLLPVLIVAVFLYKLNQSEDFNSLFSINLKTQGDRLSECPNCGEKVKKKEAVCPHCYSDLKKNCPNCGSIVDIRDSHCPNCNTRTDILKQK